MAETVNAIVALGGFFTEDYSALDAETTARIDKAAGMVLSGISKHLIVTGGYPAEMAPANRKYSQAYLMGRRALELGVSNESIAGEERSFDTIGNAVYTKEWITEEKGWKNLLIVTSGSHLRRSLKAFDHVMGEGYDIHGETTEYRTTRIGRIHEMAGNLTLKAVTKNTERGDDPAIRRLLYQVIPGYNPYLTRSRAVVNLSKSLYGHPPRIG
jgi:uncharacterized SAM-binding protein YcdF (DUF218 family)